MDAISQLREFNQSPSDYSAVAHIISTVWGEPAVTANDLRRGDEERPSHLIFRRFVAEIDEQLVGHGSYSQNERYLDPQRFWITLDVLPNWQRQGIGAQLYEHILALMQTEHNVNELHANTSASRAHTVRFLTKRGFHEEKRDPRSRLELATFDWEPFHGITAKVAAMGIEIKALSTLMEADANALRKVYELHQSLVQDVPSPAPHTKVDFESWKDGYSPSNPHYMPEANFMAFHHGDYIGLTSLWGNIKDDILYTGMSGVVSNFRRKGIMTALKLQSIAFAQKSGTHTLMTSNNSENPMLQINLKLGFKIYDANLKFVQAFHPEPHCPSIEQAEVETK